MSDSLRSMDYSLPDSSVYVILWARILDWVVMPSSRGSYRPQGSNSKSLAPPALAGVFFNTSATWEYSVYKCNGFLHIDCVLLQLHWICLRSVLRDGDFRILYIIILFPDNWQFCFLFQFLFFLECILFIFLV